MKPIKLSELIDALESGDSNLGEYVTRVDTQDGRTVMVEESVLSAVEEGEDESLSDLPEWQKKEVAIARAMVEDPDRFLEPPSKYDFHEYRHMEKFIQSLNNADAAEQLWRAIKGKGAFRYFKDTADRLGLLDEWFAYRDNAMKEFVIEWADNEKVPYIDDTRKRRSRGND